VKELGGPTLLLRSHDVSAFDCASPPLNTFLARHALANQANNSARTFVALDGDRVVGYYSLAASAVTHEGAPSRMSAGLAQHPIPVILMARFAVDLGHQGRGIGSGMFRDAISRTLNVSREIGARAFVVHAKDDRAAAFYTRLGMQAFPENAFHLFLLIKDIEEALRLR
jgi:predicted N-acetyltransferase YhbS